MVRIHQGASTVIPTVFSDLLGAVFLANQHLCADLCADLTQDQPYKRELCPEGTYLFQADQEDFLEALNRSPITRQLKGSPDIGMTPHGNPVISELLLRDG